MSDMATLLQRRPITVDEYYAMAEAGILKPGERTELLRGEIVTVPPMGEPHRGSVNRLNRILHAHFADRAYVQVQSPVVVLDDSVPEPDVALLEINEAATGGRRAYPADVVALIEVAQTSRAVDMRFKGPLYAEAGVREYWIVDLVDGVIRVHRDPSPVGYRTKFTAGPGERVEFAAFPNEPLEVSEILG